MKNGNMENEDRPHCCSLFLLKTGTNLPKSNPERLRSWPIWQRIWRPLSLPHQDECGMMEPFLTRPCALEICSKLLLRVSFSMPIPESLISNVIPAFPLDPLILIYYFAFQISIIYIITIKLISKVDINFLLLYKSSEILGDKNKQKRDR